MEYLHYLSLSMGAVGTYFLSQPCYTDRAVDEMFDGSNTAVNSLFYFYLFIFLINLLSELIHLFVCLFDFFIILLFKIIHI